MGHKNREIEVKLFCKNWNYQEVCRRIQKNLKRARRLTDKVDGESTDLYFKVPAKVDAQFVRLRKNGSKAQLTCKGVDRGDNLDRIEIDLNVSSYSNAKQYLEAAHGSQMGKISKAYEVYFTEDHRHTNVSVYKLDNQPYCFVELEALNAADLKSLYDCAIDDEMEMAWCTTSLFEAFVLGKGVVERTVDEFFERIAADQK